MCLSSVLGVFSNNAARFCPSPFFTQCPYTRNAQPSTTWKATLATIKQQHNLTFRSNLILYGSVRAVSRLSGSGVNLIRCSRTIALTTKIAHWNFCLAWNLRCWSF